MFRKRKGRSSGNPKTPTRLEGRDQVVGRGDKDEQHGVQEEVEVVMKKKKSKKKGLAFGSDVRKGSQVSVRAVKENDVVVEPARENIYSREHLEELKSESRKEPRGVQQDTIINDLVDDGIVQAPVGGQELTTEVEEWEMELLGRSGALKTREIRALHQESVTTRKLGSLVGLPTFLEQVKKRYSAT
mmetsp:Transcript_385/g.887  ORF Transcript_385/g.887 Transcript_385/m.887 type:complete len:187 (+) Transcript_385:151-711(+)